MDEDHGIAIQVSCGAYTYTTQVMGTPWSPDVFNDISKQALRGLKELVADEETTGYTFVAAGEADDVLERLLKLTDESGD